MASPLDPYFGSDEGSVVPGNEEGYFQGYDVAPQYEPPAATGTPEIFSQDPLDLAAESVVDYFNTPRQNLSPDDQQISDLLANVPVDEWTPEEVARAGGRISQLLPQEEESAPQSQYFDAPEARSLSPSHRLLTPEEAKIEAAKLGPKTLGDTLSKELGGWEAKVEKLPFGDVVTYLAGKKDDTLIYLKEKGLIPNSIVSPEEHKQLVEHTIKRHNEDAIDSARQEITSGLTTFGNVAVSGAVNMPKWYLEIYAASALGGAIGAAGGPAAPVTIPAGAAIGGLGMAGKIALGVARKALAGPAREKLAVALGKATAKAATALEKTEYVNLAKGYIQGNAVARRIARVGDISRTATILGGVKLPSEFGVRIMPTRDEIAEMPDGDIQFVGGPESAGDVVKELGKSFLYNYVQTATEFTGGLIDDLAKIVGRGSLKYAAKAMGVKSLDDLPLAKKIEAIKKIPWVATSNRIVNSWRNHASAYAAANNIPGEYAEERINDFANALLNLDRNQEKLPISERLKKAALFEIQNPMTALGMAASFSVWPMASRVGGTLAGAARPYDIEQNQKAVAYATKKFADTRPGIERVAVPVSKLMMTGNSRPWWGRVMVAMGFNEQTKTFSTGSMGYYLSRAFGMERVDEYEAFQQRLIAAEKADPAGKDNIGGAAKIVAKSIDAHLGQLIVEHGTMAKDGTKMSSEEVAAMINNMVGDASNQGVFEAGREVGVTAEGTPRVMGTKELAALRSRWESATPQERTVLEENVSLPLLQKELPIEILAKDVAELKTNPAAQTELMAKFAVKDEAKKKELLDAIFTRLEANPDMKRVAITPALLRVPESAKPGDILRHGASIYAMMDPASGTLFINRRTEASDLAEEKQHLRIEGQNKAEAGIAELKARIMPALIEHEQAMQVAGAQASDKARRAAVYLQTVLANPKTVAAKETMAKLMVLLEGRKFPSGRDVVVPIGGGKLVEKSGRIVGRDEAELAYQLLKTAGKKEDVEAVIEAAVGKEHFVKNRPYAKEHEYFPGEIEKIQAKELAEREKAEKVKQEQEAKSVAVYEKTGEEAENPPAYPRSSEGPTRSGVYSEEEWRGIETYSRLNKVSTAVAAKELYGSEDEAVSAYTALDGRIGEENEEALLGTYNRRSLEKGILISVLNALGRTGFKSYARVFNRFGQDPIFAKAILSPKAWDEYRNGPDPYADDKEKSAIWKVFKTRKEEFTDANARDLYVLGTMRIVGYVQGVVDKDGRMVSASPYSNAAYEMAATVHGRILPQLRRHMSFRRTGDYPMRLRFVEFLDQKVLPNLRADDASYRIVNKKTEPVSLEERLEELTGIGREMWINLGKDKKGADRLAKFRGLMYYEVAALKAELLRHGTRIDENQATEWLLDTFIGGLHAKKERAARELLDHPKNEKAKQALWAKYPIVAQVAKLNEARSKSQNPVQVTSPQGKRLMALTLPSNFLVQAEKAGKRVVQLIGLKSNLPGEAKDFDRMSNEDFGRYLQDEFDNQLMDEAAFEYLQWVGQMGDRTRPPNLISMPLYRVKTEEQRVKTLAELEKYTAVYDSLHKNLKEGQVEKIKLLAPAEIRALIDKGETIRSTDLFRLNTALNSVAVWTMVHGNLTQYESWEAVTKRGGTLISPSVRFIPNVEGGPGDTFMVIPVIDPTQTAIYPAVSGGKQVVDTKPTELADGFTSLIRDTSARFAKAAPASVVKGNKAPDTWKLVYDSTTGTVRTLLKCSSAKDTVHESDESSFVYLVNQRVGEMLDKLPADKRPKEVMVVYSSAAKLFPISKKDLRPIVTENADGTWTVAEIKPSDMVPLNTADLGWQLDPADTTLPHEADMPRQLPMAFAQWKEEMAPVNELLASIQEEAFLKVSKMSPLDILKDMKESVLLTNPELADVLNETRPIDQLTRVEKSDVARYEANYISKATRTRVSGQIKTVNNPSGQSQRYRGPGSLRESRFVILDPRTGQYAEADPVTVDKSKAKVIPSQVASNVAGGKYPDMVTGDSFDKDGKLEKRGTMLPKISGASHWQAINRLAVWLLRHPSLRPDLFETWDMNPEQWIARLNSAEGETPAFAVELEKVMQLQRMRTEKVGNEFVAHIGGELFLYQRVPSHGPGSVGIGELTRPIPGGSNITMLPLADWKRTGSDFDIDAWFQIHFTYKAGAGIRDEGTEGKWNKVLFQLSKIFMNPNNLSAFYVPVDTEAYDKDIIDPVKSEAVAKTGPINTPEGMLMTRAIMVVGQLGLGAQAVTLRSMSDLIMNRGVFAKGWESGKIEIELPSGRTLSLDFSPQRMKSLRVGAIQTEMGIILNLFLDNGKLQKAFYLGFRDASQVPLDFLLMAGSPEATEEGMRELRSKITEFYSLEDVQKELDRKQGFRQMKRSSDIEFPDEYQEDPAKGVVPDLFRMAGELSNIQRFANLQFNAPQTAIEIRQARAMERDLRENNLRFFDTSVLFPQGKPVAQLKPSINLLDLLEKKAFTPDLAENSIVAQWATMWKLAKTMKDQQGNDSIMLVGGDMKANKPGKMVFNSPRSDVAVKIKNRILQALMTQALARDMAEHRRLTSSTLAGDSLAWIAARTLNSLKANNSGNEFLKALRSDFGKRWFKVTLNATNDAVIPAHSETVPKIKVTDTIQYLELEDPIRRVIREHADNLPQRDLDLLALHTLSESGPATFNWGDAFYNLLGPKMQMRLNALAVKELRLWNVGIIGFAPESPQRTTPRIRDAAHVPEFAKALDKFLSSEDRMFRPALMWNEIKEVTPAAVVTETPAAAVETPKAATSRKEIEAHSFRIVSSLAKYDVLGMRVKGKTILDAAPGEPGWLGNPFVANDVAGGKFTREEATAKFKEVFLARIDKDPAFKKAILALRGKTVGYYKPGAAVIHLHVIQDWLAEQEQAAVREELRKPTPPAKYHALARTVAPVLPGGYLIADTQTAAKELSAWASWAKKYPASAQQALSTTSPGYREEATQLREELRDAGVVIPEGRPSREALAEEKGAVVPIKVSGSSVFTETTAKERDVRHQTAMRDIAASTDVVKLREFAKSQRQRAEIEVVVDSNLASLMLREADAADERANQLKEVTPAAVVTETPVKTPLTASGIAEDEGEPDERSAEERVWDTMDEDRAAGEKRVSWNWENISEYKGVKVQYTSGMLHRRLGHPLAAKRGLVDGAPAIFLDKVLVKKTFADKQWTRPLTPGVTPLPEYLFNTESEWARYILEHEYQHTQIPAPAGPLSDADYAAFETRIDDAALHFLRLPSRSSLAEGKNKVPMFSAGISIDYNMAAERLTRFEGRELRVYDDKRYGETNGYPAIGPGYRLFPKRKAEFEKATGANFDLIRAGKASLNAAQYNALVRLSVDHALDQARKKIPGFDVLRPEAKVMLVDLFHWGVFPREFKKSFAAAEAGDWKTTAKELRDSVTYRRGGNGRTRLEEAAKVFESRMPPVETRAKFPLTSIGTGNVVIGVYDDDRGDARSVVISEFNVESHGNVFGHALGSLNRWRYYPDRNKLWFWEYPEDETVDRVTEYLFNRYGVSSPRVEVNGAPWMRQDKSPLTAVGVSSVSDDGTIQLSFDWRNRLLNHVKRKYYDNGLWDLPKMLTEAGLPKEDKTALIEYAKGKGRGLEGLVAGYESGVLPKLIIVPMSQGSYERLSVNKGQGEYKEYAIKTSFPVPGEHDQFNDPNLAGWFRAREYTGKERLHEKEGVEDRIDAGSRYDEYLRGFSGEYLDEGDPLEFEVWARQFYPSALTGSGKFEETGLTEINEIQSELFQKNKFGFQQFNPSAPVPEPERYGGILFPTSATFVPLDASQVAALNLLLKDQNWANIFTQAIVKQSANRGFKRVRFPTGETAAHVEGHLVLVGRLKALQEELKLVVEAEGIGERGGRSPAVIADEIRMLKTEGVETLTPIEAFYTNRIGAIVKRLGATPVTDANGNTWQEVKVTPAPTPLTSSGVSDAQGPQTSQGLSAITQDEADKKLVFVNHKLLSAPVGPTEKVDLSGEHVSPRDLLSTELTGVRHGWSEDAGYFGSNGVYVWLTPGRSWVGVNRYYLSIKDATVLDTRWLYSELDKLREKVSGATMQVLTGERELAVNNTEDLSQVEWNYVLERSGEKPKYVVYSRSRTATNRVYHRLSNSIILGTGNTEEEALKEAGLSGLKLLDEGYQKQVLGFDQDRVVRDYGVDPVLLNSAVRRHFALEQDAAWAATLSSEIPNNANRAEEWDRLAEELHVDAIVSPPIGGKLGDSWQASITPRGQNRMSVSKIMKAPLTSSGASDAQGPQRLAFEQSYGKIHQAIFKTGKQTLESARMMTQLRHEFVQFPEWFLNNLENRNDLPIKLTPDVVASIKSALKDALKRRQADADYRSMFPDTPEYSLGVDRPLTHIIKNDLVNIRDPLHQYLIEETGFWNKLVHATEIRSRNWLQRMGYSIFSPREIFGESQASKDALERDLALKFVLEEMEDLDITVDSVRAKNVTAFTDRKPRIDKDTGKQEWTIDIDAQGNAGNPRLVWDMKDPRSVADILVKWDAAHKANPKVIDDWRTILAEMREFYDTAWKTSNDRLSPITPEGKPTAIDYRQRYVFHHFQPRGDEIMDEDALRRTLEFKYDDINREWRKDAAMSAKFQTQLDKLIQEHRDSVLEELREATQKDREEGRAPEETGRVKSRVYATYREALTHGYLPAFHSSAALAVAWQKNVSSVGRNRMFLNVLAAATDADGAPKAVFSRDASIAADAPSALVEQNAMQQLENLFAWAQKDKSIPNLDGFAINRNENPWTQINTLLHNYIGEKRMLDWGYRRVIFPNSRFNFSEIWVQDGIPYQLLMHVGSRGYKDLSAGNTGKRYLMKFLQGVNYMNSMTKQLALGFSFFHHFAQLESFIGGMGIPWVFNPKAMWRTRASIKQAAKTLSTDPSSIEEWIEAGIDLSISSSMPDEDRGGLVAPLDKVLQTMQEKLAGKFAVTRFTTASTIGTLRYFKRLNDHFLWNVLQPTLKFSLAQSLMAEIQVQHPDVPAKDLRRDIANLVNDLYGGQNWVEYLWATPFARDVMRSLIFAPDWCVVSSTRAITKTGYKTHRELAIGDEILGYDPATEEMRWMPLKDKYVREDYDGEMVTVRNYNKKIMMTPEHKCWVTQDKTRKSRTVLAKDLNTHCLIPRVGNFKTPEVSTVDDWLVRVESLGVKDNYLSWEFLSKLTRSQLELLCKTMMLGDGTGQNIFCGEEREVFNMTLLQTMLGRPSTFYRQEERCWRTRTISSKYITCANGALGREHYSGAIWCPSVETGYWMAEKDGMIFATGNTISAINSARIGEMFEAVAGSKLPFSLAKPTVTGFTNQFLAKRYWPAFMAIVLFGLPNLMQFLIYQLNKLRGEPDKDMKPFTIMNEGNKKLHIDVTPLAQMIGAKYPPTLQRRVYIQWGKQGLELTRWFTQPKQSYLSKSSTTVKAALEQLTGKNSAGWDMPWKTQEPGTQSGLMDIISVGNDVTKGRAWYLARSFIPMSLLTTLDNRPSSFFAPTSLGISQMAASKQLQTAFYLYAEDSLWGHIHGVPPRVKKMEALVPDIIDALLRNGYSKHKVKDTVKSALGDVRRRYNFEIADELQKHPDKPDDRRLETVVRKIDRIQGTYEKLNQSLELSLESARKTFTPEERKIQRAAITQAWKTVLEQKRNRPVEDILRDIQAEQP